MFRKPISSRRWASHDLSQANPRIVSLARLLLMAAFRFPTSLDTPPLPATGRPSIWAATMDPSSSRTPSKTGWRRPRSRQSTSPWEVLGRMATFRASTTSCATSASTTNSSAFSWRPESSSRPGGSNTTSHFRTAHLATKSRWSLRGAATLGSGRPPGSLGPELPSMPKPTTNNNQQNFRSELFHLRGQASSLQRKGISLSKEVCSLF